MVHGTYRRRVEAYYRSCSKGPKCHDGEVLVRPYHKSIKQRQIRLGKRGGTYVIGKNGRKNYIRKSKLGARTRVPLLHLGDNYGRAGAPRMIIREDFGNGPVAMVVESPKGEKHGRKEMDHYYNGPKGGLFAKRRKALPIEAFVEEAKRVRDPEVLRTTAAIELAVAEAKQSKRRKQNAALIAEAEKFMKRKR